jgi:hypothetical protein
VLAPAVKSDTAHVVTRHEWEWLYHSTRAHACQGTLEEVRTALPRGRKSVRERLGTFNASTRPKTMHVTLTPSGHNQPGSLASLRSVGVEGVVQTVVTNARTRTRAM